MLTHRLFLDAETPPPQRRAVAERLATLHPDRFANADQTLPFLRSIHLPASLRWAFLNNGKAGTSSARRFLFQIEFGVPLTTAWNVPHDINPDSVVHNLQGNAGVLRAALVLPMPLEKLSNALRMTTVRNPISRAISAFEYLCKSHDLAHSWFAQDRLRMNAVAGFNWMVDPRTATGFLKFLDYLQWSQEHLALADINPHWRAQIDNIVPAVYRPDIIGRVEDMPSFFRIVADHLSEPCPESFTSITANRQEYPSGKEWVTSAALSRIRSFYARDFDWLGYDPETAA